MKFLLQNNALAVAVLTVLASSCGKAPTSPKKFTQTPMTKDAGGQVDPASLSNCTDNECPEVEIKLENALNLGGRSLRVVKWSINGFTETTGQRDIKLRLKTQLPNYQITSESKAAEAKNGLVLLWKPEEPTIANLSVKARDVTRCKALQTDDASCDDMGKELAQFDKVLAVPYEILEMDDFNSDYSSFFQQFTCEAQGVPHEAAAAANSATNVIRSIAADARQKMNTMSQTNANDVATVFDYLFNKKDKKPTPYECLQRISAAQQRGVR